MAESNNLFGRAKHIIRLVNKKSLIISRQLFDIRNVWPVVIKVPSCWRKLRAITNAHFPVCQVNQFCQSSFGKVVSIWIRPTDISNYIL